MMYNFEYNLIECLISEKLEKRENKNQNILNIIIKNIKI